VNAFQDHIATGNVAAAQTQQRSACLQVSIRLIWQNRHLRVKVQKDKLKLD
jgi:hypothetical protein